MYRALANPKTGGFTTRYRQANKASGTEMRSPMASANRLRVMCCIRSALIWLHWLET